MKRIKVIACDNHPIVLKGYRAELQQSKKYELIDTALNGKELLEILRFKEAEIIILDIEMPVMDGEQALRLIKQRHHLIKVLISTMHHGPALVAHFAKLGAYGFLPKDKSENLIEALDTLSSNRYYFDNNVAEKIVGNFTGKEISELFNQVALDETEIMIVKLICENKTNQEIANSMNISKHTVDSKRRVIYEKIMVSNLPDLVKYALKHGIISLI
jgi:DNA-binding NarL/FixJ family response regulator